MTCLSSNFATSRNRTQVIDNTGTASDYLSDGQTATRSPVRIPTPPPSIQPKAPLPPSFPVCLGVPVRPMGVLEIEEILTPRGRGQWLQGGVGC